jgi:hypothetical protein
MPIVRTLARTTVLFLSIAVTVPARATAQTAPSIRALEDSLTAPAFSARARAVAALAERPRQITATGLTRLIDLLRAELDGTAPKGAAEGEGDEGYSQYVMTLTQLVARFNDPRATPLLARQGIAITGGAAFQVAMAGDAAIAPLVATWHRNLYLRAGVVRTMAHTRYYADSTRAPLSADSRATIDEYLLRAAVAPKEWLRRAFVDAVAIIGDPSYLPLMDDMRANDPAFLDGMRYVAREAGKLVPLLAQRRVAATPASLLEGLQARQQAACRAGWITGRGLCRGLTARLTRAQSALTAGKPKGARRAIRSFVHRLDEAYCRGADSGDEEYAAGRDERDEDDETNLGPPCALRHAGVRTRADPNERQRGEHDDESVVMVSDAAYVLLRQNAAYLFSRL